MPVTELALLRLSEPTLLQNPAFQAKLSTAKTAMESFTNRPFDYYQQIEDPSLIYILGAWDSLDQHLNHWIPSAENQRLLELLKDDLSVEWLLHIDVDKSSLPLAAPVLGISRHFVADKEKRDQFERTFRDVRHHLDGFVAPPRPSGGWVVDTKPLPREEFVLFSGWKEVAEHGSFAESAGFVEYRAIVDYIVGSDAKHAKRVDLS